MQLKAKGYIKSRRGQHGVYLLARPLENICIGQVIRMIDGPLAPISCVSQTAYERCTCPSEEHCGLRMLMLDVRSAIANIADHYTLADVVEVTLRKLRKNKMPLPFFLEQLVERPVLRSKAVKRSKESNDQSSINRSGNPIVSAASTWALCFEKIENVNPAVKKLLRLNRIGFMRARRLRIDDQTREICGGGGAQQ